MPIVLKQRAQYFNVHLCKRIQTVKIYAQFHLKKSTTIHVNLSMSKMIDAQNIFQYTIACSDQVQYNVMYNGKKRS